MLPGGCSWPLADLGISWIPYLSRVLVWQNKVLGKLNYPCKFYRLSKKQVNKQTQGTGMFYVNAG